MIPKYNEIEVPILKILNAHPNKACSPQEIRQPLAEYFKLTQDEINEGYASGQPHVFYHRIHWAFTDLLLSKLIERPRRAEYIITDLGREKLANESEEEIMKYITKVARKQTSAASSTSKETNTSTKHSINESQTPIENLYNSFYEIRNTCKAELLKIMRNMDCFDFEQLVVMILQKMGYGGKLKDSGIVTQKTNDGGIDGFIKEDILGLNLIAIQAKRYAPTNHVSREEVQRFVGAVAVTPSKKGVFITTSEFTEGAKGYVASLNGNPTIKLINGEELSEFVYESGLGMQTEEVLTVKKIDRDFWELD